MSEAADPATNHEPRKLGLLGKAMVAFVVSVTAGLIIGAIVLVRAQRIERENIETTTKLLESAIEDIRPGGCFYPLELADGGQADPTGMATFVKPMENFALNHIDRSGNSRCMICAVLEARRQARGSGGLRVLDTWGNPILYRCPGPVHKNGFDLISCGPNGVYEEGGGDDIVVGEDFTGGIAMVKSDE